MIRLFTLLGVLLTLGFVAQATWVRLDDDQRSGVLVGAFALGLVLIGAWMILSGSP